jgi:hypothetical protein
VANLPEKDSKDGTHITKQEASRAYVKVFQPYFWDLIENRLSILHPNVHPYDLYPMKDVYEVARAILQGSY